MVGREREAWKNGVWLLKENVARDGLPEIGWDVGFRRSSPDF